MWELFLVLGLLSGLVSGDNDVLPEVWNDLAFEYLQREGEACPACPEVRELLGRQPDFNQPDFNLTQLRVEMAKSEILRGLGMSAPPSRRLHPSELPSPLLGGEVFKQSNPTPAKPPETIRFSTHRLVVIATDMKCRLQRNVLALKFKIIMPDEAVDGVPVNGRLWFYSNTWQHDSVKVEPCGIPSASTKVHLHPAHGGWLEGELSSLLESREECYFFSVELGDHSDCSHYLLNSHKPFIFVDVKGNDYIEGWRKKRQVNCMEGLRECCREELYLSFADIGWGDWIIRPHGYNAYYCKGTCANAASISIAATPYHSVLKKLYLSENNKIQITTCCTPTRLSPVQLIYTDNNGTVKQRTIPNLTVETCGCM